MISHIGYVGLIIGTITFFGIIILMRILTGNTLGHGDIARLTIFSLVNGVTVMLFWEIGRRLK
jgi:hypothetical protein